MKNLLDHDKRINIIPVLRNHRIDPCARLSLFLIVLIRFVYISAKLFIDRLRRPAALVYRRPPVYKTDRLHLGYSCSKLSLFKGILFLRDEQDAINRFPRHGKNTCHESQKKHANRNQLFHFPLLSAMTKIQVHKNNTVLPLVYRKYRKKSVDKRRHSYRPSVPQPASPHALIPDTGSRQPFLTPVILKGSKNALWKRRKMG